MLKFPELRAVVSIAVAMVLPIAVPRAVAQSLSLNSRSNDDNTVCYLRIVGRSTQDLRHICGKNPNSPGVATPRVNPAPSTFRSQPTTSAPPPTASAPDTSAPDTEECNEDEAGTCASSPQPAKVPPKPFSTSPSTPLPPAVQPLPVPPHPPPGQTAPTALPSSPPRIPPSHSAGKPLIPNRPAERLPAPPHSPAPTTPPAATPPTQGTRPSTALPSATAPAQSSGLRARSGVPQTAVNPSLLPLSSPLPPPAPTASVKAQPSLLDALLQNKSLYLFWLICLQIPLLKVAADKLPASTTQQLKAKLRMLNRPLNNRTLKFPGLFQQQGSASKSARKNASKNKLAANKLIADTSIAANRQSVANSETSLSSSGTHMAQSAWQQLKQQQISCEQALERLVNPQGVVSLELLDREVSNRFLRQLSDQASQLPVIPLLLWRNCYYLGSAVALSDPELQQLSQHLKTGIQVVSIVPESYQQWASVQTLLQPRLGGAIDNSLPDTPVQEDITAVAEYHLSQTESQIERIQALLGSALRNRASDIHLEPNPDGLRVRFRIDGILRQVTTLPPEISRRVIVSLKVMCDMDISESRRPQDGRIGEKYSHGTEEAGLDLRVSTLPCVSGRKGEPGEKAVLRLLRQQNTFQSVEDLGFSQRALGIYQTWLTQPQGLIILTGPTGSGKTSTLYTSLQAIATDSVNIVTVEDPVEYILPGITQTQVNEPAGMTFAAGLRAILRQDPDIIMLGEIRDSETAETAVRAALTGHLVLTTLHTNDAIGAIPRLRDIGPDPGLISDALLGVIAQRLVRRVCPHCAEPHTPTEADLKLLSLTLEEANPQGWRRGRGCPQCFQTGYLGREAVIELLDVDDAVRQIIYEGTITQLHQYLNEERFDSFRMGAIAKVTTGITTAEEVRRVLPHSALSRKSLGKPKVSRFR